MSFPAAPSTLIYIPARREDRHSVRLRKLSWGFFKVGPHNSSAPVDSRTLVVSTTVFATKVRESTLVLRTLEKPCNQPDQLPVGDYSFVVTASNGINPAATQTFTISIAAALAHTGLDVDTLAPVGGVALLLTVAGAVALMVKNRKHAHTVVND